METNRRHSSWLSWVARAGLVLGAVALARSPDLPYWEMKLLAPQYPKGLKVLGYPDRIAGDVKEIDGLNHYIGMKPLEGAATFERSIGRQAVYGMVAVMILVAVLPWRWGTVLLVPVILFPAIFLADMYWWLRDYGLNLDPNAPLNRSIKPFVPTLLGEGKVGQFRTVARLGDGHYLAMAAAAASLFFGYVRWFKWYAPRPAERTAPHEAAGWPTESQARRESTAIGVATLIALGLSSSTAGAATWTVSQAGPLTSLPAAIQKASDGDTIEVAGGTYAGPLVVTKRVRLVGRDWPVIDGGGKGTVVTLAAAGITFEGFAVRGSGDRLANEDGDGGILVTAPDIVVAGNRLDDVLFGVSLREAPRSVVRNNVLRGKPLDIARRGDLVRLWWSHGATVEGNNLTDGRDLVLWYSKELTIRDNTARRGRYGIHFMYCDDARVIGNRLADNSVGTFLMYSRRVHLEENWIENNRGASGYGVGLKDMDSYALRRNVIAGNRTGIFMEGAHGEIDGNLIAFNFKGVVLFPSCTRNSFRDNTFRENGEQVTVEGNIGVMTSNVWERNFWSDYRGIDRDGDGFGDEPYRPVKLFERLIDRNSSLQLFASGPAADAIDFSARVLPVFQPQPKFIDERPRTAPLQPPLTRTVETAGRPWIGVGAGLLAAAFCLFNLGGLLPRFGRLLPAAIPPPSTRAQEIHPAVRATGVTKRFGTMTAVADMSFEVRPGEAVALWGPNGAGKTTLIRCLLGLVPFEGNASVFGQPCGLRGKASRRLLGYVPQEVRLPPDQTVSECVRFYARLRRVPPQRGIELLAEWGLDSAQDKAVRDLSGGMRQKLALVLALLSDPPVLLLDEPTSNLDATAREEFGRLLARLKSAGRTLLFCTHRAGEIVTLADRVVVMEGGRKVADGPPDALRDRLLRPAVLRMAVAMDRRADAVEILRGAGYAVRADGGELWVDVPAGRKAEPLALLQRAEITLLDFDVETDPGFEKD